MGASSARFHSVVSTEGQDGRLTVVGDEADALEGLRRESFAFRGEEPQVAPQGRLRRASVASRVEEPAAAVANPFDADASMAPRFHTLASVPATTQVDAIFRPEGLQQPQQLPFRTRSAEAHEDDGAVRGGYSSDSTLSMSDGEEEEQPRPTIARSPSPAADRAAFSPVVSRAAAESVWEPVSAPAAAPVVERETTLARTFAAEAAPESVDRQMGHFAAAAAAAAFKRQAARAAQSEEVVTSTDNVPLSIVSGNVQMPGLVELSASKTARPANARARSASLRGPRTQQGLPGAGLDVSVSP